MIAVGNGALMMRAGIDNRAAGFVYTMINLRYYCRS
ncbi:hypothetical protein SAMN05414139_10181 [Burkholderia sp. D7]|nr:hypothetical protein SAMN05414139_10181 [Burkholderia sp. D7]